MDTRTPQAGQSKASWGKLIAGAAIVVGAVMFAPTFFPNILEGIGEGIKNLLFDNSPGVISKLVDFLVSDTGLKVAGVTMMAGGATYLMSGNSEDRAPAPMDNASFTAALDAQATERLALLRLAGAGNIDAQRALTQQVGRG